MNTLGAVAIISNKKHIYFGERSVIKFSTYNTHYIRLLDLYKPHKIRYRNNISITVSNRDISFYINKKYLYITEEYISTKIYSWDIRCKKLVGKTKEEIDILIQQKSIQIKSAAKHASTRE